jgi:hypothetical protein
MKKNLVASLLMICAAILISSPVVKMELPALDLNNENGKALMRSAIEYERTNLSPFELQQKNEVHISLNEESSAEVNQIPQEPDNAMPPNSLVRMHNPGDFFRRLNVKPIERFQIKEPRFRAHKSCNRNSNQLQQSFRETMKDSELTGEQVLPEGGAILDLNFYFQHAGKYYQLSMEPLSRTLEEYRISLLQSSSPDFSTELSRVEDGRMSQLQQLARLDAITNLKLLIDDYTAQGARWGTRTILLADASEHAVGAAVQSKMRTKVEFHDGALWGFMNGQQECHLAEDNALECLCW